jgi:hypothetical protein
MRLSQLLTRLLVEHPFAKVGHLPEATASLIEAVKALVEANTNGPLGQNFDFDNSGQARHATMTAPSREYLNAMAQSVASRPAHDAFLSSSLDVSDGVPHGTELTDMTPHALILEHPEEDARFMAEVSTPEFQEAKAKWEAHHDRLDEHVPHGTDPEPAPVFDPMADLRAELAEMAAEDDEPPPAPDEVEVWERRLTTYRSLRLWVPSWGPRPGQEGCLVPYELLSPGGR